MHARNVAEKKRNGLFCKRLLCSLKRRGSSIPGVHIFRNYPAGLEAMMDSLFIWTAMVRFYKPLNLPDYLRRSLSDACM